MKFQCREESEKVSDRRLGEGGGHTADSSSSSSESRGESNEAAHLVVVFFIRATNRSL